MSAEATLLSTLTAAAGVTAIVGSGSNARIYPDVAPLDTTLPAIAFARVNTEYVGTFSNPAVFKRVQFDIVCHAATNLASVQLADAVETALVAASAFPTSRRGEYDAEAEVYGAVLSVDMWE